MKFRLLPILLFILFLGACNKKDTVFIKKINNKSSKNITFYFYGNFNPQTYGDSVIVTAGQLKEIYSYSEENSSVSANQACRVYNDSIRTVIVGGGTLNKHLQEESGWTQETIDVKQICTFEITDADIL